MLFHVLYIIFTIYPRTFRYILHNFGLVYVGEEFLSLDAETLIKVISEDKLKSSSEEQVWLTFKSEMFENAAHTFHNT